MYAASTEGDILDRDVVEVEGDEHTEELVSDSAAFVVEVDAHHVVPLPMPVTDSRFESGALVKFADSDMCTIVSTAGRLCGMKNV